MTDDEVVVVIADLESQLHALRGLLSQRPAQLPHAEPSPAGPSRAPRSRPTGCTCRRSLRRWLPDGTCATCCHNVLEEQLTPLVLQILCGGTGATLWRNARGFDTHFPNGERRKGPIRYGVGDGGADYLGLYNGRFLAVEMKTPLGSLQPNQRNFGALITRLGGIYAVCRSVDHARQLLAWLQSGGPRPEFVFAAPQESQ